MSFVRDTRSVEQQRFFDGQRLAADDLQGIEAFNREMRWLHNQSLHQPGIGNGFAVAGKKGDRTVTVGPGYAIDDRGREIVLTSDRVLPVPPVSGDGAGSKHYLLTVAYPDDADLEIVEQRLGICSDPGATRLRIEPVFCWQPLNPDGTPVTGAQEIVIGRQLTLAEIAVRDCALYADVSVVSRRNAKPANQPFIFAGEEKPADWRPWIFPAENDPEIEFAARSSPMQFLSGFEAWVDTSIAGFISLPEYFCRIDGNRVIEVQLDIEGPPAIFAIDGMVHIADATPDGFLARVLVFFLGFVQGHTHGSGIMGSGADAVTELGLADFKNETVALPWSVVWMGVEG